MKEFDRSRPTAMVLKPKDPNAKALARPVPNPNKPEGYRFLTNTEHETLLEYIEGLEGVEYDIKNLVMLDDAYDDRGRIQDDLKAVFIKE